MDHVYICQKPARPAAPLVLDSPHSGRVYPPDFIYACPKDWLDATADSYVDELFGEAPSLGLPLLAANFPRCYIDPNRAENDIDPLLLEEPWPDAPMPSTRSQAGVGLIRRLYRQHDPRPIYGRRLSVAEVRHRINAYYRPYHEALGRLLDDTAEHFGAAYHLNCHSMPAQSGAAFPDIVLGDRDGTTSAKDFTAFAAGCLEGLGYKVAINTPYKGVELVRKFSDPGRNRHSLQIELRRSLYMDERSLHKTSGFAPLRSDMTFFLQQLIEFTNNNMINLAAD